MHVVIPHFHLLRYVAGTISPTSPTSFCLCQIYLLARSGLFVVVLTVARRHNGRACFHSLLTTSHFVCFFLLLRMLELFLFTKHFQFAWRIFLIILYWKENVSNAYFDNLTWSLSAEVKYKRVSTVTSFYSRITITQPLLENNRRPN